jgi:hypothetical protein
MATGTDAGRRAIPCGVGHSSAADSEAAGREAVRLALEGHTASDQDLVILFTSVDHDVDALYAAAVAEAAPAGVFGCTSTGGFTHSEQVPSGCVAALLESGGRSFGVCHVERDDNESASSASSRPTHSWAPSC